MKKNWWLMMTASAGILLVGALLTMGFRAPTSQWESVGQALGLALLITGAVSLFREGVVNRLKTEEVKDFVSEHEHASLHRLAELQKKVEEQLKNVFGLLRGAGMRVECAQRRGYAGYHKWLLEDSPQEIFFAGHSVLHRVQADFKSLRLLTVEDAIIRKVSEGSQIRILYLDPTWDFVEQIAVSEQQDAKTILTDLATTLGICRNLWEKIHSQALPGSIQIRTCRELTQYAFHYVLCPKKNQSEMLIGFYFAGVRGMETPLFIVEDKLIEETFIRHFDTLFGRATELLFYAPHGTEKRFQSDYFRECTDKLAASLGREKVTALCEE